MTTPKITALVFIDLQEDYLASPDLRPDRDEVVDAAASLLRNFRERGAPVAHVRTSVSPTGDNAMPHRRDRPLCVAGTWGASAPRELTELTDEAVVSKQHYSGFSDGNLDAWLRVRGVERVVIAGLYTHACVRQAAIDAYERGFDVYVALDACATNSPAHAEETLAWMGQRFVTVTTSADIVTLLSNRSHDETQDISHCVTQAAAAQIEWAQRPIAERRSLVASWREVLVERRDELADAAVSELGKPLSLARDEVTRAIAHVDAALSVFSPEIFEPERIDEHVAVLREPVGTIALVMPWNNPIALPVSNIAPALLGGNAIVFKPAPESNGLGTLLMQTLAQAGIPKNLVVRVASTVVAGRALVRHPVISAVAFTGSISAGRDIAMACARRLAPVRAELGGNNAVIVLADADLSQVVRDLVRNAFAFAGQRCTALRRAVVSSSVIEEFQALLIAEVGALRVGDPRLDGVTIGPMVSLNARERVFGQIHEAVDRGSSLLEGGERIDLPSGPALSPALIRCDDPSDPIVQKESFGPVLVLQSAGSLAQAIELANGVEQGLVQAACTRDSRALATIQSAAEVGIFHVGAAPLPVHSMAAFVGRKASGFGGAEHGRWDLEFYTRPRTDYGTPSVTVLD